MNIYDKVLRLLTQKPETRSSDKKLLLEIWRDQGILVNEHLNIEAFIRSAVSAETITRARRKVQEVHKNLRAEQVVSEGRREVEKEKGLFIFRKLF